jgi:hypothetical protein
MRTRILLLTVLTIGVFLSTYGQEEKEAKWKPTSVGVSFGFAGAGTANTTEDYINLSNAVNNPDLFIDPKDYNFSSYNYGFGGNTSTKVYFGLTPYNNDKGEYNYNRELRFSIGSGMGTRRTFNYYRYDNFTVDTFQSVNGNSIVLADSSIYDRYIYQETFNEVNIGVSYLFKTPYERRFQFQAGGALEYAYAYRSYVNVENYNEKSIVYYDPADPPVYEEPDDVWEFYDDDFKGTKTSQRTNMKGATHFIRASVPLGVNFRIARKQQSFFNNVYLWLEMNPGLELQIVSDDKTYANPYFGMAWLGITYRW